MEADARVKTELLRLTAYSDLLLDALKAYKSTLLTRKPTVRTYFLFSSLLKLRQQGRAAELLAAHVLVEEILTISRTMTEVAINAAYLQDAEDQEVDCFQHFDTQSFYKYASKLRPHTSTAISAEEQANLDEVVAAARLLTEKKDTDSSWSKRTLFQRAEFSDICSKLNVMTMLALTTYVNGHQAVHGSYTSLEPFFGALASCEVPLTTERLESLAVALGSVNFVLFSFGGYVSSFMRLDMQAALVEAGKLMFSV